MMRSFLLAALFAASAHAWTTGSSVSSFGGSVLMTPTTTTNSCPAGNFLEMKKGKPNVPVNLRGNYRRQQEMSQMRDQMVSASKPGADGMPVFNLFVRTKKANMWYPCGSFKGDEKSKSLAQAWADGGMMAGISKNQLDGGIAGSLYTDLPKLQEGVCRSYPQLRKSRDSLEWGYKLAFDGLPEDKAKVVEPIEPKEMKGALDGIKNFFGN
ncbi:expressed unknown protein [Seminavis robusta]|uniref:Uncharacterized protein n=1 Tax=Seminavis robusta TaxID=568900 RepID=A0A9N8EP12_9STRA|nr:expressed unknown protein [Seminavis robusta]|eukprot:Sro1315_g262010.1 n/a (211) ;mRNA; f:3223-4038